MGIPEATHKRAPETRHHDFDVDSLMYFAQFTVEEEMLTDDQRDALRRVTEDELQPAEFEHIRLMLREMQGTDPTDECYLMRQAALAAGILALPKWDRRTREVLAWIAIRLGTLHHGFSFRPARSTSMRDSSTRLVQGDPHEMFARYSDAASIHLLLGCVFIRAGSGTGSI